MDFVHVSGFDAATGRGESFGRFPVADPCRKGALSLLTADRLEQCACPGGGLRILRECENAMMKQDDALVLVDIDSLNRLVLIFPALTALSFCLLLLYLSSANTRLSL